MENRFSTTGINGATTERHVSATSQRKLRLQGIFFYLKNKDRHGYYCGVASVSYDSGLGYVARTDDLAADLEDLFLLVPAFIHVEIDAECGREHGGGEVLGVIPRLLLRLTECVVLADVAVGRLVCGYRAADRCGKQPLGLVAAGAAHDTISDSARNEELESLGLRYHLAPGGEYTRYLNEVAFFDSGVTQGSLEGMQLILVSAHTLREKYLRGYKIFQFSSPFLRLPPFALPVNARLEPRPPSVTYPIIL